MRRIDIINSAKRVKAAILQSELMGVMDTKKDINANPYLNCFKKYISLTHDFREQEHQIIEIFGLEPLSNVEFWAQVIGSSKEENNRVSISRTFRRVGYFLEHIDMFVDMLKQDNIDYTRNDEAYSSETTNESGQALLTVILPEDSTEQSQPRRLVDALNGINDLYDAFATINNENSNKIVVAAIDSGSDKSFDFLGAAKVVSSVKEFIIDLWDKVVFYRERKFAEKLKLVKDALPIIANLEKMKEQSSISPEQCELLKRKIFSGVEGFLAAGAMLPEFHEKSTYNPREIMATKRKLLTESTPNDEAQAKLTPSQPHEAEPIIETISSEEMDDFKAFQKFKEEQKKLKEAPPKKRAASKKKE